MLHGTGLHKEPPTELQYAMILLHSLLVDRIMSTRLTRISGAGTHNVCHTCATCIAGILLTRPPADITIFLPILRYIYMIHLYICKPSMQMIFKKSFIKEWFFTLACCTIQGVGRLWHSKSKWIVKSCICKRKRFAVSMLFYAGVLYHSVGRL